jgi:hypothetical protein
MFLAVPMLMGQNSDHVEVGAFVDYFGSTAMPRAPATWESVDAPDSTSTPAFNDYRRRDGLRLQAELHQHVLEWRRHRHRKLEPANLHGFFGPKLQTGSPPIRVFVTGKAGFDNFSIN